METSNFSSISPPDNNALSTYLSHHQENSSDEKNKDDCVEHCVGFEENSMMSEVQKLPVDESQQNDCSRDSKDNDNVLKCVKSEEKLLLDRVQNLPAIFQSQQMEDPDLTIHDKRKIAEKLLQKNPVNFLIKFGEYLEEEHLNYFLDNYMSYEVEHYVKKFKNLLNDRNKKILKRNRRYEAMKKLETEGIYFSEAEMEKREPLLYHQMVGQYLSEKEKLIKNRQTQGNIIPTFSTFLINKMDRDELDSLVKAQQEEENKMEQIESSSEEEATVNESQGKRWGEDWEDKISEKKVKQKKPKKEKVNISSKEKVLLLEEFKSIMRSNFLNGKDSDFDYSEVDLNPEYDSIDIRTRDEEEKYFDEETYDGTVCTDTGIEDY